MGTGDRGVMRSTDPLAPDAFSSDQDERPSMACEPQTARRRIETRRRLLNTVAAPRGSPETAIRIIQASRVRTAGTSSRNSEALSSFAMTTSRLSRWKGIDTLLRNARASSFEPR
jgi:hypothetical protein